MNYNHFDMLPEQAFKKTPFGKLATLEGGGGKSPTVERPTYTPPRAAPVVEETSTQTLAATPEDEMKRKQDALRLGAKSLQIPTTTGATATGQVGTGTA